MRLNDNNRNKTKFQKIYRAIVVIAIILLPIGMYFGVFGSFRNDDTNILIILGSIALVPLAIIIGLIGKQFGRVWSDSGPEDFALEILTDPLSRDIPGNIWHREK